jgi:hypothetical protein
MQGAAEVAQQQQLCKQALQLLWQRRHDATTSFRRATTPGTTPLPAAARLHAWLHHKHADAARLHSVAYVCWVSKLRTRNLGPSSALSSTGRCVTAQRKAGARLQSLNICLIACFVLP